MSLADALQRAWLHRGPVAYLLWPLSAAFGGVAALRRWAYRHRLLPSHHAGIPVVVVGNVVAGGSGKTPLVIGMLQHLGARGLKAGLVSRGYGRTSTGCREVTGTSSAAEAGDEALLVARRCQVPVFVASDRTAAMRALRAAYPATQVIVSDDGLQHYALGRDIEVCVFDQRGVGNGWLLPAGPLREPWPRPVDLVVRTGASAISGFEARRRLAGIAFQRDGTRLTLADLSARRLMAVAGIGQPAAFFAMLRDAGLKLEQAIALSDHHAFDRPVSVPDGCELVCTEKDAVKLWELQPQAWAVPLALELEPAFWPAFDRLLDAKLSSRHGLQTA